MFWKALALGPVVGRRRQMAGKLQAMATASRTAWQAAARDQERVATRPPPAPATPGQPFRAEPPGNTAREIRCGFALSHDGFDRARDLLGVDDAKLWAVMDVETGGAGFYTFVQAPQFSRQPKILYERHYFRDLTGNKFSEEHGDLSGPARQSGEYGDTQVQYDRLARAYRLDRAAALKSASWGLGQVMGRNHEVAGFGNVEDFVAAMRRSEDDQLLAMANFIKNNGLATPLQQGDWAAFARGYNGKNYARHDYDGRLEDAYLRHKRRKIRDLHARAAQYYVAVLGLNPGRIDGVFGGNTERAIRGFLEKAGADADAPLKVDQVLVDMLRDAAIRIDAAWPLD